MLSNPNFVSRESNRLKAFPTGWFLICFSDELKTGDVKSVKFMGQDLVAFRTESGKACVSDAFCPHMGAHFAYGGQIEGEAIRCPFHGFCFDTEGTCVKTGYGTKPPRKAKLRTWPIQEMNGLVLVYHHQDGVRVGNLGHDCSFSTRGINLCGLVWRGSWGKSVMPSFVWRGAGDGLR